LLENPTAPAHFGAVPQCDGMAEWKKSSKLSANELDNVADFVASFAQVPADTTAAEWAADPKLAERPGLEPFTKECGQCHLVGDSGLTEGGLRDAPDLFAWGSPQWIARMIRKPGAPEKYGYLEAKDQMPSFAGQLTDNDVETVVRYLKNDYLGAPNAAAPPAPPKPENALPPPPNPQNKAR
jgi:mono/diheme cytochrome c family protein